VADKKILKELDKTVKLVTKNLDDFRFHEATQNSYHFFWHEFCDYYIEKSKKQLQAPDIKRRQTLNILLYVLLTSLKLLHPFMPFITEEIYQKLPMSNKKECLMVEKWPE
jgi:valyl-tRNA synthetase